jgi:hypothetical protein
LQLYTGEQKEGFIPCILDPAVRTGRMKDSWSSICPPHPHALFL